MKARTRNISRKYYEVQDRQVDKQTMERRRNEEKIINKEILTYMEEKKLKCYGHVIIISDSKRIERITQWRKQKKKRSEITTTDTDGRFSEGSR